MPENSIYGGWPASGEIDIMEHVNVDGKIYGTLHFGNEGVDSEKGGVNKGICHPTVIFSFHLGHWPSLAVHVVVFLTSS